MVPVFLGSLADHGVDQGALSDAGVAEDGDVKVVGELLTEEFYGIATPDGSDPVALINDGIATIIEDGTYAEIYQNWFGAEPPELPETSPVE